MSFAHNHARVCDIVSYTEKILNSGEELGVRDWPEAQRVDGIPVVPMLFNLCNEVRKINPRLKFGFNRGCGTVLVSGIPRRVAASEVWVYLPEQQYAMLRIGYQRYYVEKTNLDPRQYGVYSRLITNNKYKDYNEMHHMALSKDGLKALATVKRYLRPYTPKDIVECTAALYGAQLKGIGDKYTIKRNTAVHNIRQHASLLQELKHLVSTDYEFKYPRVKEAMLAYLQEEEASNEHRAKARHAWHVTVAPHRVTGEQEFTVTEMFNCTHVGTTMGNTVIYTPDTLSQDIAGRVAVLMMTDVDTYVEDVGMRMSPTAFFIDRTVVGNDN